MAASPASIFEGMFAASEKVGLSKATFLTHILPPFVVQYLMGVLVQLEGTRLYRLALLPLVVWFAWRATLVDMSGGDVMKTQSNGVLITQMSSMVTRSAVWAFACVRYRRHIPASNQDKSDSGSIYTACWNCWDLLISPRGIGWNWSQGLVVRKPLFETDSHVIFVLSSVVGIAFHGFAFDICLQGIRAMSPETFGSINGGSLFDGSLPPDLELLRAMLVSGLGAAAAYFGVEYSYRLLAIVCVVVFRQHPSQWPPIFNSPWLSTSLSELWGRRFHQLLRDMVLTLGAQPFGFLFGRLGGLLGAFFVSGLFHDVELRSSGRDVNSLVVVGFWTMNGIGVVLERIWKRVTGRPVGGVWGWIWMVVWLTLWGIPTVNEYAKVGRFGALRLFGGLEPSLVVFSFVKRFFLPQP